MSQPSAEPTPDAKPELAPTPLPAKIPPLDAGFDPTEVERINL